MSGGNASTGRPARAMSSRLLTMKFMQRAAASESPKPLEEPMAKRQKLSNGSPRVLNSTSTFGDATAIRAALAAEEAKREEALSRQSRGDDETRWMFSFRAEERGQEEGLKVQKVGYAGLDAYRIEGEDSEELWKPDGEGRKIFGKYRRKESKQANGNTESHESTTDSENEDDHSDEDSRAAESEDMPNRKMAARPETAVKDENLSRARRRAKAARSEIAVSDEDLSRSQGRAKKKKKTAKSKKPKAISSGGANPRRSNI